MDRWLETKQLPVHFVSAAGLVYKDDKVLLIKSNRIFDYLFISS